MEFHILTQIVKFLSPGAQLQGFKTFRLVGQTGYWVCFEFFPAPGVAKGRFWLGLNKSHGSSKANATAESFAMTCGIHGDLQKGVVWPPEGIALPHPTPLQAFCRAHLVGRRLQTICENSDQKIQFGFGEGHSLLINFPSTSESQQAGAVEFLIEIPGRPKPYLNRLQLGVLADSSSLEPLTKTKENVSQRRLQDKSKRLIVNIQSDIHKAQEQMEIWNRLSQFVESNPRGILQIWEAPQSNLELASIVGMLVKSSALPPPSLDNLRVLNEKIFKKRKHFERRVQGAQKRLNEIQNLGTKAVSISKQKSQAPSGEGPDQEQTGREIHPKKRPGLWVLNPNLPKVWARVGRKSLENDELFRQARDRDVWFHVKNIPGGHVWIARGQPDFGAKGEVSEGILKFGCQLALVNAKLKPEAKAAGAEVEYTERRHLKKMKGLAPGVVRVMLSKSRFVRLDPEFENHLKGK